MNRCTLIGKRHQYGYTYLLMLFVVALLGYTFALTGVTWHKGAIREISEETEFILAAYAQALESYRLATPDGRSYRPQRLEELAEDNRRGSKQRHIRRLYKNPLTGRLDWTIDRDELGIVGVCSPGSVRRCSARE